MSSTHPPPPPCCCGGCCNLRCGTIAVAILVIIVAIIQLGLSINTLVVIGQQQGQDYSKYPYGKAGGTAVESTVVGVYVVLLVTGILSLIGCLKYDWRLLLPLLIMHLVVLILHIILIVLNVVAHTTGRMQEWRAVDIIAIVSSLEQMLLMEIGLFVGKKFYLWLKTVPIPVSPLGSSIPLKIS